MQRTCHKTIVIHPHTGQFVINELPTLVLCGTVWVYGGMEGLPLTAIATVIALMLSLLLLYRYLYLRRIRYCIGTEQLVRRIRYYPSQSGLYGAISYRGFSRAPKPAATTLWAENRTYPFNGPKHAPS